MDLSSISSRKRAKKDNFQKNIKDYGYQTGEGSTTKALIKNVFSENYCHSATSPLFKGLLGVAVGGSSGSKWEKFRLFYWKKPAKTIAF